VKRTIDVLEKTFYLERIRIMEIRAYMVQIALMVGMGFFFSLIQGARFKPFYMPMEYFSFVVLIMVLAMIFESFFFTMLEIKNQDSDSARYIITKKASKNAIKIMLISLILIALFTNPFAEGMWENALEEHHQISMNNGTVVFEFSSLDRFGIMENRVEIHPVSYYGNYTVYVFDKGVQYNESKLKVDARYYTEAEKGENVPVYPPESMTYQEYTVLIKGEGENASGEFSYEVHKTVIEGYTLYSAMFLIAMAIAEAWWFVYLQKLIKKYGTELVSES
jgi:hypothetical protein